MIYDQLDSAILTAISDGKDAFYIINAAVDHLAKQHSLHSDSFRVVDRRLQALRKRGLIQHWRGKWRMRPSPESDAAPGRSNRENR